MRMRFAADLLRWRRRPGHNRPSPSPSRMWASSSSLCTGRMLAHWPAARAWSWRSRRVRASLCGSGWTAPPRDWWSTIPAWSRRFEGVAPRLYRQRASVMGRTCPQVVGWAGAAVGSMARSFSSVVVPSLSEQLAGGHAAHGQGAHRLHAALRQLTRLVKIDRSGPPAGAAGILQRYRGTRTPSRRMVVRRRGGHGGAAVIAASSWSIRSWTTRSLCPAASSS